MSSIERLKDQVFARIDATRDELASFLSEYIQHRSINPNRELPFEPGGTTECQRWLADYLSGLGCFAEVLLAQAGPDDYNVIARMPATAPESARSLLFNGHSDVVPVSEQHYEQWLGGDPWSGVIVDGSVYGRGASDMKGGNAAIIWAVRSIAECGVVPPGQITTTFVIGEESGDAALGPHHILANGCGADIAVVAEPTGLDLCPAAVGWFFFKLSVEGEASHAASRVRSIYPSNEGVVGINAIELMTRILARLRELELQWGLWEKHPLMTPGTMAINPVQISGGDLQATTPDHCSAVFAVTLSPSLSCAEGMRAIQSAIDTVCVGDPWLSQHPPVTTYPVMHTFFDPVDIPVGDPAVLSLTHAVSAVTSNPQPISLMRTPSDANLLAAAGQPAVICGPGKLAGYGVHGLNEHIPVEEVVQAAKVYAAMALSWCWQRT